MRIVSSYFLFWSTYLLYLLRSFRALFLSFSFALSFSCLRRREGEREDEGERRRVDEAGVHRGAALMILCVLISASFWLSHHVLMFSNVSHCFSCLLCVYCDMFGKRLLLPRIGRRRHGLPWRRGPHRMRRGAQAVRHCAEAKWTCYLCIILFLYLQMWSIEIFPKCQRRNSINNSYTFVDMSINQSTVL